MNQTTGQCVVNSFVELGNMDSINLRQLLILPPPAPHRHLPTGLIYLPRCAYSVNDTDGRLLRRADIMPPFDIWTAIPHRTHTAALWCLISRTFCYRGCYRFPTALLRRSRAAVPGYPTQKRYSLLPFRQYLHLLAAAFGLLYSTGVRGFTRVTHFVAQRTRRSHHGFSTRDTTRFTLRTPAQDAAVVAPDAWAPVKHIIPLF